MIAYGIAKSLLTPPGILILMLVAAFLLVRGVLGRILLLSAVCALTMMSLPAVATALMAPLETYPPIGTDSAPLPAGAQAIVVMGAGRYRGAPEYGGDTVDPLSLGRVRYAAHLHRKSGLPIYVTGGSPSGERPAVGELMADVLRDELGVPVEAVESESRTSWENAALLAPILERDGVSRILLVTDAWHLPRSVEVFERIGLEVAPAPTGFVSYPGWESDLTYRDWLPDAGALRTSLYAVNEHLGRVWYQIRRWAGEAP